MSFTWEYWELKVGHVLCCSAPALPLMWKAEGRERAVSRKKWLKAVLLQGAIKRGGWRTAQGSTLCSGGESWVSFLLTHPYHNKGHPEGLQIFRCWHNRWTVHELWTSVGMVRICVNYYCPPLGEHRTATVQFDLAWTNRDARGLNGFPRSWQFRDGFASWVGNIYSHPEYKKKKNHVPHCKNKFCSQNKLWKVSFTLR